MKTIPNVMQAWRLWSMQIMALAAVIQGVWLALPEETKASIPADVVQWVTMGLAVLGAVARVIKQPELQAPEASE
jgi:hypothetical protein